MDASPVTTEKHTTLSYKLLYIFESSSEEQPSLDNKAPCYIISASGVLYNNFPE